jgi:hypothetical protein
MFLWLRGEQTRFCYRCERAVGVKCLFMRCTFPWQVPRSFQIFIVRKEFLRKTENQLQIHRLQNLRRFFFSRISASEQRLQQNIYITSVKYALVSCDLSLPLHTLTFAENILTVVLWQWYVQINVAILNIIYFTLLYLKHDVSETCKIWSFHGCDYEEWCFLGCYAVWLL